MMTYEIHQLHDTTNDTVASSSLSNHGPQHELPNVTQQQERIHAGNGDIIGGRSNIRNAAGRIGEVGGWQNRIRRRRPRSLATQTATRTKSRGQDDNPMIEKSELDKVVAQLRHHFFQPKAEKCVCPNERNFVYLASDIVDYMVHGSSDNDDKDCRRLPPLAKTRNDAVQLGRALQLQLGFWHPAASTDAEEDEEEVAKKSIVDNSSNHKSDDDNKTSGNPMATAESNVGRQDKDFVLFSDDDKLWFQLSEAQLAVTQTPGPQDGATSPGAIHNRSSSKDVKYEDHDHHEEGGRHSIKSTLSESTSMLSRRSVATTETNTTSSSRTLPVVDVDNDEVLAPHDSQSTDYNEDEYDLESIANILRQGLDVRDRTFRLRKYRQCFVASDAIDYMVNEGIVKSRRDGIQVGIRLQKEMHLFAHVVNEYHLFSDEYLFFRFRTPNNRMKRIKEHGAVLTQLAFDDATLSFDGSDRVVGSGSHCYDREELKAIATKLVDLLDIKDRIYRFRQYKECFIASEAITTMMKYRMVRSREDGVTLGIALQQDLHLFKHVIDDHTFSDTYLFFKLTGDDCNVGGKLNRNTISSRNSCSSSSSSQAKNGDLVVRKDQSQASGESSSCQSSSISSKLALSSLQAIAETFVNGVEVKDRTFRFRKFKQCFVASDAIDFMVTNKRLAQTRHEAVRIGIALQQELNLFHHVVDDHVFSDNYLFFRFSRDSETNADTNLSWSDRGKSLEGSSTNENNSNHFPHQKVSHASSSIGHSDGNISEDRSSILEGHLHGFPRSVLDKMAIRLLGGLVVKDRKYHFRKYKKCFIAKEAIDFMVSDGLVASREEGVELGCALQMELKLFAHVVDDHAFADEYLFFRLTRDNDLRNTGRAESLDAADPSSMLNIDDFSTLMKFSSDRVTTLHQPGRARQLTGSDLLPCSRRSPRFSSSRKHRISLDKNFCHNQEKKVLRAALKRTHNSVQFAFVGGVLGVGKSMLVRSTFSQERSSFFAMTKFEQPDDAEIPNAPFAPIRELLADLIELTKQRGHLVALQGEIKKRFDGSPNLYQALRQLLSKQHQRNLMLSLVMSADSSVSSLQQSNTGEPFVDVVAIKLAMELFFIAVSSVSTTILFFDDMMWSDVLTRDVISDLIMSSDVEHLLIVGAYCSKLEAQNKNRPFHLWKRSLEENIQLSGSLCNLVLGNLAVESVKELLASSLQRDATDVSELARLLVERTDGNFFYLSHLLDKLQDLNAIYYDELRFCWSFSIKKILQQSTLTQNVGRLVCSKMANLPQNVKETLKLSVCFGSCIHVDILNISKAASAKHIEDIFAGLEDACGEQMLIRVSDSQYKFAHDEIRSAAASMYESDDDLIHTRWKIAKLLLSHPSVWEDDRVTFACADQVQKSLELVDNEVDRVRVAELSAAAGIRATEMSAFLPASTYFKMGVDILGGQHAFATQYELAMHMHLWLSKTSYASGQIGRSQEIAEAAVKYSKTSEDKVALLLTIFQCLLANFDYAACLDFGLNLVETLGAGEIARNPGLLQVGMERRRVNAILKEFSNSRIRSLPKMADKNNERCMSVLVCLISVCEHLRANFLSEMIQLRCLWMTLEYGLSQWAPSAMVAAARYAIGSEQDMKEGARYARLAEDLLFLSPAGTAHCDVALITGVVDASRRHLDLCIQGHTLAMTSGQVQSASACLVAYGGLYFHSGLPFAPLLTDIERFANQLLEYRQTALFLRLLPLWQCLLNLSGKSKDSLDVEKGEAIEKCVMVGAGKSKTVSQTSKAYGMQVAVHFGDIARATALYHQVLESKPSLQILASVAYLEEVFFSALICIANAKAGRKKYRAEAKKHLASIHQLIETGSMNLVHKCQILEAEYNSLDSAIDERDLLRNYELALVASTKSGFVADAGLCAYLAAQFCANRSDLEDSVESYMKKAHDSYLTWGAVAVANSLKSRHPEYFESTMDMPELITSTSTGIRSRTRYRPNALAFHRSLTTARLQFDGSSLEIT